MYRRAPHRLIGAALGVLLVLGAAIVPRPVAAASGCVPAAAYVEKRLGIPDGILQAIALVESGRGGVAWPWTINAAGEPHYLPDRGEAERVLAQAVETHGGSVAIGCMQIYLSWHAERFRDLSHVLDPAANVAYAGKYLLLLRARHGSWAAAVRHYHGADAGAQRRYLCRVLTLRASLGYQGVTGAMQRLCEAT